MEKPFHPMADWTRRATLAALSGAALIAATPLRAVDRNIVYAIDNMLPGEFTWHPERSPGGAVAVVVSLPEQRVHVYRNGIRIAVSTCSTGKRGHRTPTGVFTILQKDKDHRSSLYDDAPMPNMNRLTWDGIALHAGHLPGYPASHGCVRLPMEFSEKLFAITHVGTPVIVAGEEEEAWELIHPGLVLGTAATDEMVAAVAGLSTRQRPSDWSAGDGIPAVTVLATAEDRQATLIQNGAELLRAPMTIEGPPQLGEHVFLLKEPAPGDTELRWLGVTYRADPAAPMTQTGKRPPETDLLNRLHAPDDFMAEIKARMHPGMTLVVSDLAATPDRRSGKDFVIMTGENLVSPRPVLRRDPIPAADADDG